jgi:hypothetical protein
MATIKEFRADCYQGLTSFEDARHRFVLVEKTRGAHAAAFPDEQSTHLPSRNGEEPDQQAEEKQRSKKREHRVQGMELEVGIASETISGG